MNSGRKNAATLSQRFVGRKCASKSGAQLEKLLRPRLTLIKRALSAERKGFSRIKYEECFVKSASGVPNASPLFRDAVTTVCTFSSAHTPLRTIYIYAGFFSHGDFMENLEPRFSSYGYNAQDISETFFE